MFRHCFATVCTCSRTTCRLYQQCPNSCRGFIPNASLNLLWIKAFAITRSPQSAYGSHQTGTFISAGQSCCCSPTYWTTSTLFCYSVHVHEHRRTPHADSTSSVRVAAAPSCPMHQLRMPCTRALPHLALEFRFSRLCVFRHCFATVCTCSGTTRRLYQQCPNSCRGFIPNASLNLLWIKAFAINSLSTIRIRVSPDRNIHFRWPIVLLFTDILDYLHTVLLQCACARTPHADSTSNVRVAAAPSCPMHQLRMPCTRALPHLALEFRFSRFCVFRHCFATVCTCSRTTCRLYQQCPNSCRGFIPNASLNLLWIKAFAITRSPQSAYGSHQTGTFISAGQSCCCSPTYWTTSTLFCYSVHVHEHHMQTLPAVSE